MPRTFSLLTTSALDIAFGAGYEGLKQVIEEQVDDSDPHKALYKEAFPMALGIFEAGPYEDALQEAGIFQGELHLRQLWLEAITPVLHAAHLAIPVDVDDVSAFGGRYGKHTAYLQPLLDEMTEVFRIDPAAEW